MAKRLFNGSPTVDGYYTTFDSSEVHRIEESSDDQGGGGSSDFSMAEVTIEGDDDLRMTIPFIMMEADGMPYNACACITSLEGGETYNIPLYKGKTLVPFNSSDASTIEVSGNIQYMSNISAYLITGDCTITIS